MSKNHLISVIIPTYNRAVLIKESLQSILQQTYSNIEAIIVDDGSDDNTKYIINKFGDNRIKYFNIGRTKDISKVRNIGLNNASGDYIAFCDDDDIWFKNKLELQLNFIEDFNFICTNAEIIDKNGGKIYKDNHHIQCDNRIINTKNLLLGNEIYTSSVLINKKIISHGFIEKNSTKAAEDYELWLRLSLNNKIFCIGKPLIYQRKHSNTSSFDYGEKYIELLKGVISILSDYELNKDNTISLHAKYGIIKQKKELCKILFKNSYYRNFALEFYSVIRRLLSFKIFTMIIKRVVFKKYDI